MNSLKVGFGRIEITPKMGVHVAGYYEVRIADGVLDPLEANALALQAGGNTVLVICFDLCNLRRPCPQNIRKAICEATGLPYDNVYLTATHTHTGPINVPDQEPEYHEYLVGRAVEAAKAALADLQPAKMGYAVGQAPNIAFVRRFRMKDGSIRTNPGMGNPEIESPIGRVDERVNVLRFDRENDTVVLCNLGCHPDVVGGCKISADWPGFTRRRLEKALDNVKCIFMNGAEGDVNHVNVNAKGGDMNDLFMDFDDVSRGYGHARHMGNVVAGAVLQVFDKVTYTDVDSIRAASRVMNVPSQMPKPEDIPGAQRILELHRSGRDEEIPFKGMQLTTVVAEATRMVNLKNGPESFPMTLSGLAIGNIGFLGIPGEPFCEIGRALKLAPGWDLVLPSCLTNDAEGYFPTEEAFAEGGYEARSSRFAPGVAELIIAEGTNLLNELHEKE